MNNGNTVKGKNIAAPIFCTVGNNTIALSSIKLCKADGSDCEPDYNMMNLIKDNGGVGAMYTWTTFGRNESRHFGWADKNGEEVGVDADEVNFPQGTAFVIETEAAGVQIKTAGEVEMGAEWSFNSTVKGKNLLANPLAKTVMLSTIKLTKSDGSDCEPDYNMMNLIKDNGGVGAMYTWTTFGRNESRHFGWADKNGEEVGVDAEDVPFAIGTGFVLEAEAAGVKVIFKQ